MTNSISAAVSRWIRGQQVLFFMRTLPIRMEVGRKMNFKRGNMFPKLQIFSNGLIVWTHFLVVQTVCTVKPRYRSHDSVKWRSPEAHNNCGISDFNPEVMRVCMRVCMRACVRWEGPALSPPMTYGRIKQEKWKRQQIERKGKQDRAGEGGALRHM